MEPAHYDRRLISFTTWMPRIGSLEATSSGGVHASASGFQPGTMIAVQKAEDWSADQVRCTRIPEFLMNRNAPAIVVLLIAFAPSATRVNAELATSLQQTGNLGMEMTAMAGGNALIVGGTLTLTEVPASASIVKATLYASQVENSVAQDARFAGTDLGSVGPYASDPNFVNFYTYAWDVTSLIVPGVNSYSFRVGGNVNGTRVAGVALLVVWHDWSEPTRIITINDGMLQVGADGAGPEVTTFENLGVGETDVWLFTILDDDANTGEVIDYNGATIGGPIDQNLGPLASLFRLDSTSTNGTNTLLVDTVTDHMGWMVAATAVVMPPVPVTATTWQRVKQLYR